MTENFKPFVNTWDRGLGATSYQLPATSQPLDRVGGGVQSMQKCVTQRTYKCEIPPSVGEDGAENKKASKRRMYVWTDGCSKNGTKNTDTDADADAAAPSANTNSTRNPIHSP